MKLANFTDLMGEPIWMISTSFIVKYPLKGVHSADAGAVIIVEGTLYEVLESPEEVIKILKEQIE